MAAEYFILRGGHNSSERQIFKKALDCFKSRMSIFSIFMEPTLAFLFKAVTLTDLFIFMIASQ
jgi:hypothetical protein